MLCIALRWSKISGFRESSNDKDCVAAFVNSVLDWARSIWEVRRDCFELIMTPYADLSYYVCRFGTAYLFGFNKALFHLPQFMHLSSHTANQAPVMRHLQKIPASIRQVGSYHLASYHDTGSYNLLLACQRMLSWQWNDVLLTSNEIVDAHLSVQPPKQGWEGPSWICQSTLKWSDITQQLLWLAELFLISIFGYLFKTLGKEDDRCHW